MTTNAPVGPTVAAVDIKGPKEASCLALKRRNNSSRKKLPKEDAPSTITHGQFTQGGTRENLWSRSKGSLASKYMNGSTGPVAFQGYKAGLPYTVPTGEYTEPKEGSGAKPQQKMKAEPTNIKCDGSTFAYRPSKSTNVSNPEPSHTEARIIEDLFAANKGNPMSGTLTMAIDWPQKNSASKEVPCSECERVICGAMKCGLEIILCKEGKPEPQDKSNCSQSQAPK